MLDIRDFGALGDGVTINTAAIQVAIDCAAGTGETVLIPAGVFRTGTLLLKGASLHLESGAVLKASEDLDDYPVQPFRHNEMGDLRALLVNIGYDNVCIDGSGTIDLSGKSFYDTSVYNVPKSRVPFTESQKAECTYPIGKRPNQCIFFHNSKNITLRGIRVIDAPCWTMTFSVCENVKVLGLTIDTDLNVPNNDGMHICSSNGVLISDCHISSGVDCIALSGITAWEKPCENSRHHELRAAFVLEGARDGVRVQHGAERADLERHHPGEQPGPHDHVQRRMRAGRERARSKHGDRHARARRKLVGERRAHLLHGGEARRTDSA